MWTVGVKLSDEQTIPDGDEIMGIIGFPGRARVPASRNSHLVLIPT
jgi:hypothetical protein